MYMALLQTTQTFLLDKTLHSFKKKLIITQKLPASCRLMTDLSRDGRASDRDSPLRSESAVAADPP